MTAGFLAGWMGPILGDWIWLLRCIPMSRVPHLRFSRMLDLLGSAISVPRRRANQFSTPRVYALGASGADAQSCYEC